MEVVYGIEQVKQGSYAVVTAGTFDGVHLGHAGILKRLTEIANANSGESVVITYHPHPRLVLQPDYKGLKLLTTLNEKIALIAATGISKLVVIPFTHELSAWGGERYIQEILVNALHTNKLVIGYDHRFGKNREGGFEYLRDNAVRFGFEVEEIPRRDIDDSAVSSTRIRQALLAGDVDTATHLLGRSYAFTGTVIKGKQLGRLLGYPTANLHIADEHKLVPGNGIYAVRVLLAGQIYGGMMSIGTNPTVNPGSNLHIEVNIFDFTQDIYGEEVTVQLVAYLRPEARFDTLDALKEQIGKDKVLALSILAGGL